MSDNVEYRPNAILSSSQHFHKTLKCPTHGCAVCSLRAKNGGTFWACPHCTVTFSYDGSQIFGDPAVVTRASKNHGRTISRRERVRSQLEAGGFTREESEAILDKEGLLEAEKLVA